MCARRPPRNAPPGKNLASALGAIQTAHPDATVEVWAMDEHRVGLQPIGSSRLAPADWLQPIIRGRGLAATRTGRYADAGWPLRGRPPQVRLASKRSGVSALPQHQRGAYGLSGSASVRAIRLDPSQRPPAARGGRPPHAIPRAHPAPTGFPLSPRGEGIAARRAAWKANHFAPHHTAGWGLLLARRRWPEAG